MANDRPRRPREAGPPSTTQTGPPRSDPAQAAPSRGLGSPRRPPETDSATGSGSGARAARRALLVAGLAGGAVAGLAVARRLGRDVPPLYRSLRTTPLEFPFRGHRVVWYTAGRESASPVVLIHGIHATASAHEMEGLFQLLSTDHRVYAYDLLGFGASERPEVDYDAELYVGLLREFLRREVRRPAHVVAASLSAAHAIELAAENPDAFASLTVIDPVGLLTAAEGQRTRGRLVESILRAPWIGEALYNLLVSRPSLRHWLGHEDAGGREHHYTTAHQPGARYASAAFFGDALTCNTYVALRNLRVPLQALWSGGSEDPDTEAEQTAFAAIASDADHTWTDAGPNPHERAPDEVAERIRAWIAAREPVPGHPAG